MPIEMDLHLPRNAFTPRDAARAGDVWRCCQDAAVLGASRLGWDPPRFRREGAAFVVREMTTVHHAEGRYGDVVRATTWISNFRRALLCSRQIRLNIDGKPFASSTQEWAHVSTEGGRMRAARAKPRLVEDMAVEGPDSSVSLPNYSKAPGTLHTFTFTAWHTWMDPLAHANHPAYVDWAEEAVARLAYAGGVNPMNIQPVAESAKWRVGAMAPDQVTVTTRQLGRTAEGAVVCVHEVTAAQTGPAATVYTVRQLVNGDTDRLARALA